jgi:hypothetical protein
VKDAHLAGSGLQTRGAGTARDVKYCAASAPSISTNANLYISSTSVAFFFSYQLADDVSRDGTGHILSDWIAD